MLKALIIDDEIDICYLLSSILKNKNLQVDYVNSLSEAELVLQRQEPAIIFLDNHLPDGRGMDFISHIKKNHPAAKIVMITAYDTAVDKNTALRTGADHFIGKPFTSDAIYQTLKDLVY
jgi:two-component system OmpR family response regulator